VTFGALSLPTLVSGWQSIFVVGGRCSSSGVALGWRRVGAGGRPLRNDHGTLAGAGLAGALNRSGDCMGR